MDVIVWDSYVYEYKPRPPQQIKDHIRHFSLTTDKIGENTPFNSCPSFVIRTSFLLQSVNTKFYLCNNPLLVLDKRSFSSLSRNFTSQFPSFNRPWSFPMFIGSFACKRRLNRSLWTDVTFGHPKDVYHLLNLKLWP